MMSVTVIGGYLGSGKTTLVNRLLRHADGMKIAVLVNEFGALPIDADLIEAQDESLISIAGGCVCCSYGNDLMQAMLDLGKLDPQPDHIVIEASGIALPGAIGATVSVLEGFGMDGIVVLTDAETVDRQARDDYIGDTITRQLADASLVLLNKVDLVASAELARTEDWLKTMSPEAAIISARQADVPNEVVLQAFAPRALKAGKHHAVAAFESRVIAVDHAPDAEALAQLLADPALALVRAKGFVQTPEGLRAVQVVGRRWTVAEAAPGPATGIVVIGQKGRCDLDHVARDVTACASGN